MRGEMNREETCLLFLPFDFFLGIIATFHQVILSERYELVMEQVLFNKIYNWHSFLVLRALKPGEQWRI